MTSSKLRKLQVTIARDYEEKPIEGIYYAAKQSLRDFDTKLNSQIEIIKASPDLSDSDKHYMIDSLSDDHYEEELVVKLSEELVIVALYKTVEITIKKMAEKCGLFTSHELQSFFRINSLHSQFHQKVVDLTTLPGYASYDELRCINNSVKHSGKVSPELVSYGWDEDNGLESLWSSYERLKPGVRDFVYAL